MPFTTTKKPLRCVSLVSGERAERLISCWRGGGEHVPKDTTELAQCFFPSDCMAVGESRENRRFSHRKATRVRPAMTRRSVQIFDFSKSQKNVGLNFGQAHSHWNSLESADHCDLRCKLYFCPYIVLFWHRFFQILLNGLEDKIP